MKKKLKKKEREWLQIVAENTQKDESTQKNEKWFWQIRVVLIKEYFCYDLAKSDQIMVKSSPRRWPPK